MIKDRLADLKNRKYLLLTLFLPIYLIAFMLVERNIDGSSGYWVSHCFLDDHIPFLEGFVIPYVFWYILMGFTGVYLIVKDIPAFKRYMYYLILVSAVCMLIFIVFPNGETLRPTGFEHNNFCTTLIGFLYASDSNMNVLPSMHVCGALGAAFAFFDSSLLRKFRWPVAVVAATVCLSTVFIKQHSVLDVFAGIMLSFIAWFVIYKINKKRPGDIM